MIVLYLHQYFNTLEMGGSTRSLEMARRLVQRGHEVHLITSDRSTEARNTRGWRTTVEEGITVHWTRVPYSNRMGYGQRIRSFFEFACRAAFKAASIKADVAFATSTPLTIALPAVYAARRNRIPMVLEIRDLWPAGPIAIGALRSPFLKALARRLERFAYSQSTRIVALAPGMKEHIVRSGYPASQVSVIPNGADLQLFDGNDSGGSRMRATHEWLKDRPLVVYVGTIGKVNGVDYLVRLAAQCRKLDPGPCFAVIGEGGELEKVERMAADLGVLNQNLFLVGPVPKRQVASWFAASDMTVSLIIDKEVFWRNAVTNKFFDSLAAGRPIANNHGGWQSEIAIQEDVGIMLHPTDLTEAARQLVGRLHDREWLEGAGARAKFLARERFSRDILAGQLEKVLLDALPPRCLK